MENITIVGMKDLVVTMSKIERHLGAIEKSLEQINKVNNRKLPPSSRTEEKTDETDIL